MRKIDLDHATLADLSEQEQAEWWSVLERDQKAQAEPQELEQLRRDYRHMADPDAQALIKTCEDNP
jgi:hypothetical protein